MKNYFIPDDTRARLVQMIEEGWRSDMSPGGRAWKALGVSGRSEITEAIPQPRADREQVREGRG